MINISRIFLLFTVLIGISFSTIAHAETSNQNIIQTHNAKPPVYQEYTRKKLKKTKLGAFKKWITLHAVDLVAALCVFSVGSLTAYYLVPSFLQADEATVTITPPEYRNPTDDSTIIKDQNNQPSNPNEDLNSNDTPTPTINPAQPNQNVVIEEPVNKGWLNWVQENAGKSVTVVLGLVALCYAYSRFK